jgi:hypothetical protein
MAEIISLDITIKTFNKLLNEANFDTYDWEQVMVSNRDETFLYGNESKILKKRNRTNYYEVVRRSISETR